MTGKKLSHERGLVGEGRLIIARIHTLQNFYGLAIRNNKGNSEAMSKATMAILDYYTEDTLHDHCPPSKGSWCSFQRDVATGSSLHKPIKKPLPDAVVKVIIPERRKCVKRKKVKSNDAFTHAEKGPVITETLISAS